MTEPHVRHSRQILDPIDRTSECLFGLIMVLTFTGSLSAAESGHADVHAMLVGAIGCNLSWGIVDAVMYLMSCWTERARDLIALRAVQAAKDPASARRAIAGTLPPDVAAVLAPEALEEIRARLAALPAPPDRPRLGRRDWLGAIAVFLWVFLITFPVVIPFFFDLPPLRALRWSNAVALALLFVAGWAFGRHTGGSPWRAGLLMVLLGAVLVAIVIALGG